MDLFSASFPTQIPLISLTYFHSRPTVEFTLGIHRFFWGYLQKSNARSAGVCYNQLDH